MIEEPEPTPVGSGVIPPQPNPLPKNVWLDMETGDPDDCLTLLLLMVHSKVQLRGVSIFPGDNQQVGFVKALLRKYGSDYQKSLPVGNFREDIEKNHLGPNNVRLFGKNLTWSPEEADDEAHNLMAKFIEQYPDGTFITGGPLGNMYNFLTKHTKESSQNDESGGSNLNEITNIESAFVQGGFAGSRCVPAENQLKKFSGMQFCPTWNFGGHQKGAHAFLNTPIIQNKYLISKDVCHGVFWDASFHRMAVHFKKRISQVATSNDQKIVIWELMLSAMDSYLGKKRDGKLLHDPLAACACIDPSIITFCEVTVQKDNKGHWGSLPTSGTNTWISIGVDKIKFYSVFLEVEEAAIRQFLRIK